MFFEKLYDDAMLPTIGTLRSAGHDLHVYDDLIIIPSLETATIRTGVKFSKHFNEFECPWLGADFCIQEHATLICYGKIEISIEPRSGLAAKHDLDVAYDLKRMAGVCDQDYTKEIKVLIHNLHPTQDYTFKKGEKCAQMIFSVGLVDSDCILNIERDGGFGSTGK